LADCDREAVNLSCAAPLREPIVQQALPYRECADCADGHASLGSGHNRRLIEKCLLL